MTYLPLAISIIGLMFSLYFAVSAIRTSRKVRKTIAENRARAEAAARESNVLSLLAQLSILIDFEPDLFSHGAQNMKNMEFMRMLRELIQQGGDAVRLATLETLDLQAPGWSVPHPDFRYHELCSCIRVTMQENGVVVDYDTFATRTLSTMTRVLMLRNRLVEPQSQPEAPEPEHPTAWARLLDEDT